MWFFKKKKITSESLRKMWFKFWEDKKHFIIPSASLVPENDPSVLFTTAGMHPLVPYLLGEPHPLGKRLANSQLCVRTGDIDEVGDAGHHTFFEMLGNWSLGDFFKAEQIRWSFEFLTSKKYLGLPLNKLAFTVFAGDETAPKDEEAFNFWIEQGVSKNQIFFLGKKDNWWGLASGIGPCGPDTEMFYLVKQKCCETCSPACSCGAYMEIWNDVFMQYNIKSEGGVAEKLVPPNVDTGMGLERALVAINKLNSSYDCDLFEQSKKILFSLSSKNLQILDSAKQKAERVVLDHIRAATFIIGDLNSTVPSNSGRGYVLRKLIRRARMQAKVLGVEIGGLAKIADGFVKTYKDVYKHIEKNRDIILSEINKEEERFEKTIKAGEKEFAKVADKCDGIISGDKVFWLYETFGFPLEVSRDLAESRKLKIDVAGFEASLAKHRALSQSANAGVFKGGLAGGGEAEARLHTATHLLHFALHKVLGGNPTQKGSNITSERLRFDFVYDKKLEQMQLEQLEQIVNDAIQKNLPIEMDIMTVAEAKALGAIGVFDNKYGEQVKVYKIEGFGAEICGGPHAANTGELGRFKIIKEESSSAGVRRIKAVLK